MDHTSYGEFHKVGNLV